MFSKHIPQDIIDLVVEELRDHTASLVKCATVSSSFLIPSRKFLLFKVTLDNRQRSQCLLEFLSQKPGVISYIRQLYVNGTGWVTVENTFPSLLRTIATAGTLQTFSFIVLPRDQDSTWITLRPEARNSICDLFRSSSIQCIEIQGVVACTFQLDLFNLAPSTLRRLSFVGDHDGTCEHDETDNYSLFQPVFPPFAEKHLDSLQFNGNLSAVLLKYLQDPHCSIRLNRLRELSIGGDATEIGLSPVSVAKLAANTLEYLHWEGPPPKFTRRPPDLTFLRRLRFLSLTTNIRNLSCLHAVLTHCVLPKSLEEINVVVVTFPCQTLDDVDEVMRNKTTKARLVDKAMATICGDTVRYSRLRHVRMQMLMEGYDDPDGSPPAPELRTWFPETWFPRSQASSRFVRCFVDQLRMEEVFKALSLV